MTRTVDQFRQSGDYLPDVMRDFHDQKDLFKALHQSVAVEKHEYAKDIGWTAGQCYVIDIFLWWMAAHGYVLRKSRSDVEFRPLDDIIKARKDERDREYAKALGLTPID